MPMRRPGPRSRRGGYDRSAGPCRSRRLTGSRGRGFADHAGPPGVANYPLTTSDHLWADDDGRGEVHIGGSTIGRLGPSTAFSFLNLDEQTAHMRISGSLAVTVRRLDEDQVVAVDTLSAAVLLLWPGFYRVGVREDGESPDVRPAS